MRAFYPWFFPALALVAACGDTGVGQNSQNSYDPFAVAGTQVGVVVDDGASSPDAFFLDMGDGAATAKDALDATTLEILYLNYGFGAFVCKVNSVGTAGTVDDPCPSLDGRFWAFYYKKFGDDAWTFSEDKGVSIYALQDGDMVGLAWAGYDAAAQTADRVPPDLTLGDLVTQR